MLSCSSEKIWASAPQNPKQKCKSTLLLQSINWSDASTKTQIVLRPQQRVSQRLVEKSLEPP